MGWQIAVVALGILCILMFIAGTGLAKELEKERNGRQRWHDAYNQEHEWRTKAQERSDEWQDKYIHLLAEYNEIAEIEEGEEYVRTSLGLPPEDDEDQEESA